MLRFVAAAAALAAVQGAGLLDSPIVGDVEVRLDSASGVASWFVSNGTTTLPARVPGDLLTDLQLGGVIGDPLYELNFKQQNADGVPPWDTKAPWTYTTTSFDVPPGFAGWWLVLDGVKMVADVQLNGVPLGYTADQFLRYNYDVTAHLKPTGNVLSLTFTDSSDDRLDEERWMSCSGGWDCACRVGRTTALRAAHPPAHATAGSLLTAPPPLPPPLLLPGSLRGALQHDEPQGRSNIFQGNLEERLHGGQPRRQRCARFCRPANVL